MKRIALVVILLILVYPVMAQLGTHALMRLFPHTFADLQMADMPGHLTTPLSDGQITYCSDCAKPSTPGQICTAGGPGAEAHRIRGAWACY